MPKFNVTAEITMDTYLQPDGYFEMVDDEATDFEDESSWSEERVHATEGQVTFIIEEENEDQARDRAQELLNYALSFRDNNDVEWELDSIVTEVEPFEIPMTRGRAVEILRAFLAQNRSTIITLDPELVRAIEFLLALMAARVGTPETEVVS